MGLQLYIPWRVRNFISEHFPLFYHLVVNVCKRNNSAEYWDRRLAEGWDAKNRTWPTKNKLIEQLTDRDQDILDVACGTGSILRYLKIKGYENLHGQDMSDYAVQRLSSLGIKMSKEKLPNLPFPDGSMDVIIASQILEHLISRRKFMKEVTRVLRPEGRAFIFVPDDCLGPISEPEHVIKYNEYTLRKFLERYLLIINLKSFKDENFSMSILFALLEKPITQ